MRLWTDGRVRLACSYVGAVIGAGFASGREILHFFALQGPAGLAGAAVAGGLFAWLGAVVAGLAAEHGVADYAPLLRLLCGRVGGAAAARVLTVLFVLSLTAVLAGAAAVAARMDLPAWSGAAALAAALAVTSWWGRSGHLALNVALLPVMALYALAGAWTTLRHAPLSLVLATRPGHLQPAWFLYPLAYVAYNLSLGLAGICLGVHPALHPAEARRGAAAGGALLGALCVAATLALLPHAPHAAGWALPLERTLDPRGAIAATYPVCLGAALWTTGSAALTALAGRLPRPRARIAQGAALLLALPLSLAGLPWLVAVIYPLMGYAGFPLLACAAARGLGWRGGSSA